VRGAPAYRDRGLARLSVVGTGLCYVLVPVALQVLAGGTGIAGPGHGAGKLFFGARTVHIVSGAEALCRTTIQWSLLVFVLPGHDFVFRKGALRPFGKAAAASSFLFKPAGFLMKWLAANAL
jgi:hypothetical protein